MRLPSLKKAKKNRFDVFKTSATSHASTNVGNEIQALIFGMTCLGSFPEFLLG